MIKVMIVDDHKVLTESLRFLLDKSNEIRVVGVAHQVGDALGLYQEVKPDVVLMDIHFYDSKSSMSYDNGIDGVKIIKQYDPGAKVLILTSETSGKYMENAIHLIDGFIIKDCGIEELINSIKCCYNGLKVFDPDVLSKAVAPAKEEMAANARDTKISTDYTGNDDSRINNSLNPGATNRKSADLSEKEIRVISLMAEGKTCKEIAALLDSTEGYVRNILISIYDKLGIEHKSTALVAFAARAGILD